MDKLLFDRYIQKWEPELAGFDKTLAGWGPAVDLNDPDWLEKAKAQKSPLQSDPAFGESFANLAEEIIEVYLKSSPEQALQIRRTVANYRGVMRFLVAPFPVENIRTKKDGPAFLKIITAESIVDQWPDARDLMVRINHYSEVSFKAGIDIRDYVTRLKKLSSPENVYGMGSMQQMLDRLFRLGF